MRFCVGRSLVAFLVVRETIDDHDEVVVEDGRVYGIDQRCDEVWEDADMMCSAPQADEVPDRRPGRWERWLLFDDAVLSLPFGLAGSS